jgi:DNA-binding MarR family transcriptional regulator
MTYDALAALHARLRRLRDNACAEFGLTHAQMRVLAVVREMDWVELSFVAKTLDVTRQAVHRVVRDLARMQYLLIERGTSTGRPLILSLDEHRKIEIDGAFAWEADWLGQEVAQELEPDTHGALQNLSRWLRRVLPWRTDGIDALALDPIRYCWWEEPGGLGYATRVAASR